ncbi:MAG: EAL domain-containing protein [Lachnospiraceae bacterium]|nr:EAL domain-containing protein [Lachnospiraceae bacterium]
MLNPPDMDNRFVSTYTERMEGGAFAFRADEGHELLYANSNMVRLFECENMADFMEYTGGTYDGIIYDPEPSIIHKEIDKQINEQELDSGYVFFNIITRTGCVRRVVNHWTYVHDNDIGDVFYAAVYIHRLDNVVNDYDNITGLLGKSKFDKYATDINKKYAEGDDAAYAIIYLNLVNFKLLNIEQGVNEGNECLKTVSRILGKAYDYSFISRLSDDHFAVFSKYEGIIEKTEKAKRKFYDSYGSHYNVICKFGIYKFRLSPEFDVESALSCAKMACDYIKRDKDNDIVEYSDELAGNMKTTEYVVGKIDEALEKEWIKIYFQPVIRSLTGELCCMESLVRWIDPELGFLPPDKFIGALENERCIHKLDSYVVDRVCKELGRRLAEDIPVVPASVNFSRLDFVLCDMLEVVETAVNKYNVPKEYIHIEITESMIASNEELMKKVIGDFTGAGYEIWMDDFGSGYSSLTLLKDFHFDTLKMDMKFLTPLTSKSKSIIRSVVNMAKDIGIRTLAEGVESKEQLDFLKDIGCGMIQGYYYGRPEPVDDVFIHLEEKNIATEKMEWSSFYQAAGYYARATEIPLEIIEDDGNNFRTLFMNEAYRSQMFDEEMMLDEIDKRIYHTASPLIKKYREFANLAEMSWKPETFYYTGGGNYMCLTAQAVAEHNGHYIIKGSLINLSMENNRSENRTRLDNMLKEMNLLFESVQAVNLSENTIVPLLGGFRYLDRDAVDGKDLQKGIKFFTHKMVHPEEKDRCLKFLESATLSDRVGQTGNGYIADVFRLRSKDGGYHRCEAFVMMIPGTGGNEYLFCVKPCVEQGAD